MLNSLSGRCGQSYVSQSQEEIWCMSQGGGKKPQLLRNVESVCIFGRGYQPDMSADSVHRAGRLKMNCITTNRAFTTESGTLTFILPPSDMTWRAGLERNLLQHPSTSAPAHQHLCHEPFSPFWEARRSQTSWCSLLQEGQFLAKCSANKQRWCFYLVLTEGTLSWPSVQVRRAWQALTREETWRGQERFPSSRRFCPLTLNQTDSFDRGGVTLIYLKVSGSRIQPNKLYQFMGFAYERKGSPDSRSLGLLWWPTVKVCILLCVPLVWW